MRRKNKITKTFTLVELLVVISIIAILTALLLPVLKQVRAKGYQITCVNNQKQCGILLNFYADDYNDYFPAAFNNGPFKNRFWPEVLCNLGYLKWPAYGASTVLICPGYAPRVYSNGSSGDGAMNTAHGLWMGESAYGTIASSSYSYYYLKRQKIESDRILLADAIRAVSASSSIQAYYICSGSGIQDITSTNRVIHMRHNKQANASFADGSCRSVKPAWVAGDARYDWCY